MDNRSLAKKIVIVFNYIQKEIHERYFAKSIKSLDRNSLAQIFQHLDTPEKIKIERVCKRWRDVCWKSLWPKITEILFTGPAIYFQLSLEPLLNDVYSRCGKNLVSATIESDYCSTLMIIMFIRENCPNMKNIKMSVKNTSLQETVLRNQYRDFFESHMVVCTDLVPVDRYHRYWYPFLLNIKAHTEIINLSTDDESIGREDFTVLLRFNKLCQLSLCREIIEKKVFGILTFHINSLTRLDLDECIFLGGTSLISYLTSLKRLSLINAENFPDSSLELIAKRCKKLEYLNISGCKEFSKTALRHLSLLQGLETLKISCTVNASDDIYFTMYDLVEIDCWGCKNIDDVSIKLLLDHCEFLEKLFVSKTSITHKSLIYAACRTRKYRRNNIILSMYVGSESIINDFYNSVFYKHDSNWYKSKSALLKIF